MVKRRAKQRQRSVVAAAVVIARAVGTAAAASLPRVEDVIAYTFPAEDSTWHEATWLQWPQDSVEGHYEYDPDREARLQGMWVEMVKALHTGERVRIIASDNEQVSRVDGLLRQQDDVIDMSRIDFHIHPTDDTWVRDNGPIFVHDGEGNVVVENWKFNGWGDRQEWYYDTQIPLRVASDLDLPVVNVPMVNEGGSIEVDGRGTLMAKRSSILNDNRNPGLSQEEAELYFKHYLGATNFIWLDGTPGLDVTDDHIDGSARFANEHTIVTHYREDFDDPREYDTLASATNAEGEPYEIVHLPRASRYLWDADGHGLYLNYYVGNDVVVFPVFGDPNDDLAADIVQSIYPERTIARIDFAELFVDGGLAHCVTQQQPVSKAPGGPPSSASVPPSGSTSGGSSGANDTTRLKNDGGSSEETNSVPLENGASSPKVGRHGLVEAFIFFMIVTYL